MTKSITVINGDEYYSLAHVSKESYTHPRTIRRWIANGDLSHFLTVYVYGTKHKLYKLGPPAPDDILLSDHPLTYQLPKNGEVINDV